MNYRPTRLFDENIKVGPQIFDFRIYMTKNSKQIRCYKA